MTERTGAVPARFTAELPLLTGAEWPENGPPPSLVKDGVCWGTPGVRERFLRSLEAAARATPTPESLAPYARLVRFCRDASRCGWAEDIVASSRPLAVRQTVWRALVGCESDRAMALFDQPDAPVDAVVDHVFDVPFNKGTARAWPRLVTAAPELEKGDSRELERALNALAKGDAGAQKFIVERFSSLRPGPPKWVYGRVACGIAGDDAKRACAAACRKEPAGRGCKPDVKEAASRPRALVTEACSEEGSLYTLSRESPARKKEVADAISKCFASDGVAQLMKSERGMHTVAERLRTLAETDFAGARAAGKHLEALLPATPAPRLREELSFLDRFATPKAAAAELTRLGFSSRGVDDTTVALSLSELLVEGGAMITFDPETDQWPNEHDHLARELARPLGDQLADVVFEEVPPQEHEPYVLRAYADGRVFEAQAKNSGDWYDVDAVVGLVNSVLRRRRAPGRVALTLLGGNDGEAIAGPITGIAALVASGDVTLLSSGEDRVRKAIERERKVIRDMGATPMPGQGFE